MPTSSFYNDNLFRTFPFITTEEARDFPTKRIVAAKVLCSFGSPYESFPSVSLTSWTVMPASHRLVFRCTAKDQVVEVPLDIPKTLAPFSHVFSEIVDETRVHLTTGDLTNITQSLPYLSLQLEPTCILWLKHRGIRRVQVLNESRNRLPAILSQQVPPLNSALSTAYEDATHWYQPIVLQETGLLFSDGYNCEWTASGVGNRMLVRFLVDAGLGAVQSFPLLGETQIVQNTGYGTTYHTVAEEDSEDNRLRPDGLPQHDHILYTFSGAVGPVVSATQMQTIRLRNDTDGHTVSVVVATLGGKGC